MSNTKSVMIPYLSGTMQTLYQKRKVINKNFAWDISAICYRFSDSSWTHIGFCWLALPRLGLFFTLLLLFTFVDSFRARVDSCWFVSDSCCLWWTRVDSCWHVLVRVELCWYSCIRIDLIKKNIYFIHLKRKTAA